MPYRIELGYEGSADCCLKLVRGKESKEFLIETSEWCILSFVHRNCGGRTIEPNHDAWHVLDMVWNHYNPESIGA